MAAQVAQVLPVEHFHVVFTLPHAINALAPTAAVDGLLFACASQTLLDFARNPKWLGAEPAITMILHTWDQRLMTHRHVHCLVSGDRLTAEGEWVNAKPHFLFPVRALSQVFRGKFMAALATKLVQVNCVCWRKWGRYTHHTAIGNQCLVSLESGVVRFRWRDRAHANRERVMALPVEAFIHRFLLHVLPRGFQRIRYGLLANRHKASCLARARAALNLPPAEPVVKESVEDFARRGLGVDIRLCPVCGEDQRPAKGVW